MKTTIYVSATPAKMQLDKSKQIVEQVIRPTGLLDPEIILQCPRRAVGNVVDTVDDVGVGLVPLDRVEIPANQVGPFLRLVKEAAQAPAEHRLEV